MSDEFGAVLDRLSRVPGVRGTLVVDAEAGVPVVAELESDVDGAAVAALAASLVRRAGRATDSAGFGGIRTLQLESTDGHLVVAAGDALAVVVLTAADAQLGQVRLETRRAAETLP